MLVGNHAPLFHSMKELEIIKHHFFDLLIAIALVIAIASTVREALATSIVASRSDAVPCESLPSRYSIHTVDEAGMRMVFTEDGPTGVDGGLKELYTAFRICSRKGK
jgi:hypothetical protein